MCCCFLTIGTLCKSAAVREPICDSLEIDSGSCAVTNATTTTTNTNTCADQTSRRHHRRDQHIL